MLFQEVFLKYTWSSHDRIVAPEISCYTKKGEASSGVSVGTYPSCIHWDELSPSGSGCTLLRTQVLKKKLFLRQWRGNVHVLALHICKSKQNTVRGTGAGPRYFCTSPLSLCQEGQIRIFSCQQALTEINLSIWLIMKEVSKTKVTSISRHEWSIFFSSGEKNPSILLRVCKGIGQRCCQTLCSFKGCIDEILKTNLVLDLGLLC